jgi:hypothetical protein
MTAKDRLIENVDESIKMIDKIKERLLNELQKTSPNWADTGSIGHVRLELTIICKFLNIKP